MPAETPTPKTVIWIFTSKCNLACPHCYASIYRERQEMSLKEKLALIDEMGEMGVEHVGLSGGEPLIHPHLEQMLEKLRDWNLSVSIVTNATAVSKRIAETLYRNEVFTYVSLDGPKEVHDRIRGSGVFDKTIKGIQILRETGVSIATVTSIGSLNYEFTGWCIRKASEIGADHAALIPVMPAGKARETRVYIDKKLLQKALKIAINAAREEWYPISLWCMPFAPLVIGDYPLARTFYCRTYETIDIDPSGNIMICDVLGDPIVNARMGLKEAWEIYVSLEETKEIVEPKKLPKPCMECPIREYCKGGCYARSKLFFGDYNAGDPLCPRVSDGTS